MAGCRAYAGYQKGCNGFFIGKIRIHVSAVHVYAVILPVRFLLILESMRGAMEGSPIALRHTASLVTQSDGHPHRAMP